MRWPTDNDCIHREGGNTFTWHRKGTPCPGSPEAEAAKLIGRTSYAATAALVGDLALAEAGMTPWTADAARLNDEEEE
jgi:hypothetical protein